MADPTTTQNEADGNDDLTPAHVREQAANLIRYEDDVVTTADDATTAFRELLGKPARVAIIDALVAASGTPLTAKRITEMAGVSTSSFHEHHDDLLRVGVMREVDQVANAQRYALATDHPVAQALVMIDNLLTTGETGMLVDDRFISDSAE